MKINSVKNAGFNVIHFEQIDSTNLYALRNIKNIPDKTVIIADTQLKGRGRLDRTWISSADTNLYFSIVLKPSGPIEKLPLQNLTQYMCVMLCRIFEKFNISPTIKWPNDILINNKKVCGILSETSFSGNCFSGIVTGAGINLNYDPSELIADVRPVTSLSAETKTKIDKTNFLIDLLEVFFDTYIDFLTGGFRSIKSEYLSHFSFMNRIISINTGNSVQNGRVKDISDDGTLILSSGDGTEINILAGDIA